MCSSSILRLNMSYICPVEEERYMGRLRSFWDFICAHKYGVVIVLFVALIGYFDENSLWERYQHKKQLTELQEEIRKYTEIYERDTYRLQEMNTNRDVLTEIARERYFMKTEDEDVFVIMKEE